MKRLVDFFVSAVGLLALMPVLLLVAFLVFFDSGRPILFWQDRVGLHGHIFRIAKFRTMTPASELQLLQITIGQDPRITSVGRFLRKWKLDELPQLWNVIIGDMSIVGPRPEVPKYVALYPVKLRELVLSVRPGITDPCSIFLRNESDLLAQAEDPEKFYVDTLLPKKLQMASEYIQNKTPFSDVRIVIQTVRSVIFGAWSKQ